MERNAYIFTHDGMRLALYDASETVEMFGEDFLQNETVKPDCSNVSIQDSTSSVIASTRRSAFAY